ncbi:MBL fold metallo-hydrolase [Gordonia sp. NPDC003424]
MSDNAGEHQAAPPTHPAYGVVREVTPFASVLLCNNPGVMELDGTNTWILRAPDSPDCVIVDPGPPKHKKHIAKLADDNDISLILVTHRHFDHTGGIKRLHKRTGAPVRARAGKFTHRARPLHDREIIDVAGLRITVLFTPGHTGDSVSFLVDCNGQRAMITGDTILGRGTTVLDPSDGSLNDYMNSLNRLIVEGDDCAMLPAHGPDHPALIPVARFYKAHREERIDQIRAALADMGATPHEAKPMKVVKRVYSDVDKKLWPAARMSVKAQLEYLRHNS